MIYELVGLPAVGKSYIFQQIQGRCRTISIKKLNKLVIILLGMGGIIVAPISSFLVLKHCLKNFISLKVFLYQLYNLLIYRRAKFFLAFLTDNCLIDEGLWQDALSFNYSPKDLEFLKKHYYNKVKILFVQVDDAIRRSRLEKRNNLNENKKYLSSHLVIEYFLSNAFLVIDGQETEVAVDKISQKINIG